MHAESLIDTLSDFDLSVENFWDDFVASLSNVDVEGIMLLSIA